MFFGGNKNINKKLGAFILAFVFVVGLFSFSTSARAVDTIVGPSVDVWGYEIPLSGLGILDVTWDKVWKGKRTEDLEDYKKRYDKTVETDKQLRAEIDECYPKGTKNEKSKTTSLGCKSPSEYLAAIRKISSDKRNIIEQVEKLEKKLGINDKKCHLDLYCAIKKGVSYINTFVLNGTIELVGLILRGAGLALDTTVNFTITGMSEFLSGDNGKTIESLWSIFRDIINIFFIFGLLFISISTIIKGIGPKTKNLLVTIIASALLINFSYFFTAILIDASNFLTTEIRDSIKTIPGCDKFYNNSVSGCLISKAKLTTAFNPDGVGTIASEITGKSLEGKTNIGNIENTIDYSQTSVQIQIDGILGVLLGSVFIIISSFVLLSLAIMLLIRFIMLILLLITSPVMFLGWVIPNLSSISQKWFKELNKNLIFPPVVFLFIFITLSIADGIDLISTSAFGTIINYLLINGFMIASILMATKIGAVGAGLATKYAGNLTFGSSAKLGRTTIGRTFARVSQNMEPTTSVGRFVKKRIEGVGNRTFDMRNTSAFSGIGKATGINLDAGTANKNGFIKLEETAVKERAKEIKDAKKPTLHERQQIDLLRQIIEAEKRQAQPEIDELEDRIEISTRENAPEIREINGRLDTARVELQRASNSRDKSNPEIARLQQVIEDGTERIANINTEFENDNQRLDELKENLKNSDATVNLSNAIRQQTRDGAEYQQRVLQSYSNGVFPSTRMGAMLHNENIAKPEDPTDKIIRAFKKELRESNEDK